MGLFDFLGGTNKFKKGMEAGAKPFEAKFAQYGEAVKHLENNFGAQWNRTKEVADKIMNSIEATGRERLYGLYTQTDIKQLKSDYKEILIAALYTLSTEASNELQQSYIRSVQKYLDIKNPQISINFAGIKNIDSLIAQMAIFQSCVEYLLLGGNGPAFFEEYGENLFSFFVIKEKVKEEIWENILQIYSAIGPLGLSEKYGFVPDDGKGLQKAGVVEPIELTKLTIKEELKITEGEEKKFEKQDIKLIADILVKGALIFDHCVITYNGDDIEGCINFESEGSVTFTNCTIIGKNNKEPERFGSFISGYGGKIIIEKTLFKDCRNFMQDTRLYISIENCIFRFTKLQECVTVIKCSEDSKMENCLIENLDTKDSSERDSNHNYMFTIGNVKFCTFRNIMKIFDVLLSSSISLTIIYCHFDNCSEIFKNITSKLNIKYSLFEHCTKIIEGYASENSMIKNCKFINCKNSMFHLFEFGRTYFEITKCEFINYRAEDSDFLTISTKIVSTRSLNKCLFNGIYIGSGHRLVGFSITSNIKKSGCISLVSCIFQHCKTEDGDELIKTSQMMSGAFGKVSSVDVINIHDCNGLDEINGKGENGSILEDQIIRQEEDEEPYGVNKTGLADVGVLT